MLPQEKKSGDKGVDGIRDYPVGGAKPLRVVAQVKGGGVGASLIQNLGGAMKTHNADVGLFISLEPIKKTMVQEASLYPPFVMPFTGVKVPGLQLRTIQDLLDGKGFDLPNVSLPSQAVAIAKSAHKQADLGL